MTMQSTHTGKTCVIVFHDKHTTTIQITTLHTKMEENNPLLEKPNYTHQKNNTDTFARKQWSSRQIASEHHQAQKHHHYAHHINKAPPHTAHQSRERTQVMNELAQGRAAHASSPKPERALRGEAVAVKKAKTGRGQMGRQWGRLAWVEVGIMGNFGAGARFVSQVFWGKSLISCLA